LLAGWIGIDLTRQARRRMRKGYQTLLVSKLRRGEYQHKDAFAEIINTDNTEEKEVGRSKRSDASYQCKAGETSCCLSSKLMSMTDLGLDFIIFPSIIQYTFCQGSCATPSLFSPHIRYVWRQKDNYY
jgi:hypothetical protein